MTPNANYVKGRKKEYKVAKEWREKGYIVLRTAGSHGFADLIAVSPSKVVFIQCKPDNHPEAKTKALYKEFLWILRIHKCDFLVI